MRMSRTDLPDDATQATSSPAADRDQRNTAGQFALEIMHELRNPLETLTNLNYLILQCADDPETVRQYARLGDEQLRNLTRIALQSLNFARLSEAHKKIDLIDLAEAALRIHQRKVEAKRIHLVKRLPADLVAEVREGQILQVVSNLVANAIEAMPEEGRLVVKLRARADSVEILVGDNGPGIPETHVEKLFQPFFSTKGDEGNGLGLSLSKRIVNEHGGRIGFRTSRRPERSGTVFKVSIPRTKT